MRAWIAGALGLPAGWAFATEQAGDTLIYEGKRFELAVEPLDAYLTCGASSDERAGLK